jgi:hypothetical protein
VAAVPIASQTNETNKKINKNRTDRDRKFQGNNEI